MEDTMKVYIVAVILICMIGVLLMLKMGTPTSIYRVKLSTGEVVDCSAYSTGVLTSEGNFYGCGEKRNKIYAGQTNYSVEVIK